jgi:hypothetical protein
VALIIDPGSTPTYLQIGPKAKHLRELGMSDKAISRALGVSDKPIAKLTDPGACGGSARRSWKRLAR